MAIATPHGRHGSDAGGGDDRRRGLPACRRLRELLSRSIDLEQRRADPENQVDGFLGEGLPQGSLLWSKAGWMSQARHGGLVETAGWAADAAGGLRQWQ